jgi:SAM-dependent methyltransferase
MSDVVIHKPFEAAKQDVTKFWDAAACGEDLYLPTTTIEGYKHQADERYRLEPYIMELAQFERWRDKDVLEIGVGLGSDHQRFAEAGARLTGIDLTPRAIEHTKRRFALLGLQSNLSTGDAEKLAFPDNSFDMVFSYGVIHHSPLTGLAAQEILRVLRPGGEFRVMIYHKHSLIGFMLWARYALARLRPFTPLKEIYAKYLESPGTKAFTQAEARALFEKAVGVKTRVVLTHSDLLESASGQRHKGLVLTLARIFWPRWFLRRFARGLGLALFVTGRKP